MSTKECRVYIIKKNIIFIKFRNEIIDQFVVENGGCFDENVKEIPRHSISSIKGTNKEQITAIEFSNALERKKTIEPSKENKKFNTESNLIKGTTARTNEEKVEKFDFLYSPKQAINSKQMTE